MLRRQSLFLPRWIRHTQCLEVLNFLQDNKQSGILITSLVGARVLLPNPEIYAESQLNFVVGEDYNIDKCCKGTVKCRLPKSITGS